MTFQKIPIYFSNSHNLFRSIIKMFNDVYISFVFVISIQSQCWRSDCFNCSALAWMANKHPEMKIFLKDAGTKHIK